MNRALDVHLGRSLGGRLMQNESGRMSFAYSESWLNDAHAIPLSWSLPLRREPFTQSECRGFFTGILPESPNRESIARILGISARNDYAMLERIGGECAGAVTFLPAGTPLPDSTCDYRPLDENALVEVLARLPRKPLLAVISQ